MNSRRVATLVFANILLFGVSLYFLFTAKSKTTPLASTFTTNVLVSNPNPKKPALARSRTTVVVKTNEFHWRQVESSDYRTYITNLRAVGCPEATIRDIVLADVMKLYAEQRGQFYHNGRQFKFWETDEKRVLNSRQLDEREKEVAKIDRTLPAVLRDLLGINYDREINKYFVDNKEDERRLNFLSDEKRTELLKLREEIEDLREKVFGGIAQGELVDVESVKKIEEQRNKLLAGILTPSELHEYELSTSETANRLRAQLIGFEPTEKEFLQIYKLQRTLDEQFAARLETEAAKQDRETDQAQLDQIIKNVLGPERAADYDRVKSPEYRETVLFVARNELPLNAAKNLFEVKQIAESDKERLLSSKNVSEENAMEALSAMKQETERSLRHLLGEKVFGTYLKSAGGWVNDLATK